MGATNPRDRARLELEDIIAGVVESKDCLRPVLTRMVQRAATEDEETDLMELLELRRNLNNIHRRLLRFHPDALRRE